MTSDTEKPNQDKQVKQVSEVEVQNVFRHPHEKDIRALMERTHKKLAKYGVALVARPDFVPTNHGTYELQCRVAVTPIKK